MSALYEIGGDRWLPEELRGDRTGLRFVLTDRDQQLLELRRQLEERGDELAAARAANRELITQLNRA